MTPPSTSWHLSSPHQEWKKDGAVDRWCTINNMFNKYRQHTTNKLRFMFVTNNDIVVLDTSCIKNTLNPSCSSVTSIARSSGIHPPGNRLRRSTVSCWPLFVVSSIDPRKQTGRRQDLSSWKPGLSSPFQKMICFYLLGVFLVSATVIHFWRISTIPIDLTPKTWRSQCPNQLSTTRILTVYSI